MKPVVVGLSHKAVLVAALESFSLSGQRLRLALLALSGYIGQGIILSTCNRTEVYALSENGDDVLAKARAFLLSHFNSETGQPPVYACQGEEAVGHLFRVAAGLDSMVLGETEIQGQLRSALEAAAMCGMVSFPLSRLFHRALRVGRKVRLDTGISRKAASVSSVGVELAGQVLGDLKGRSVLVIGTGKTGRLAAVNLRSKGVSELKVTNRTYQRATELVSEIGGTAVPFRERYQALSQCDIVITATSSPSPILAMEPMKKALAHRNGRPLFIIDLAVPRDVDPQVRELPGVFLYNLDDLRTVTEIHRQERAGEAEQAEALVAEDAARFMAWWQTLEAVPTIKSLRARAEALRRRELDKTLKKLSHLSQEDQAKVEALTTALVNKLLHQPTLGVKEHASREDYLKMARQLFGLEDLD